jgi:hypothetical protein
MSTVKKVLLLNILAVCLIAFTAVKVFPIRPPLQFDRLETLDMGKARVWARECRAKGGGVWQGPFVDTLILECKWRDTD